MALTITRMTTCMLIVLLALAHSPVAISNATDKDKKEDKKQKEKEKKEAEEAKLRKALEDRTLFCMKQPYVLPVNNQKYKLKEGQFFHVITDTKFTDPPEPPPDTTSSFLLHQKVKYCVYCGEEDRPGLDVKQCGESIEAQASILQLQDEAVRKKFEQSLTTAFETTPKTFAALFKASTQIYKDIVAIRQSQKKEKRIPQEEQPFGAPKDQLPLLIPPREKPITLPTETSDLSLETSEQKDSVVNKPDSFLGFTEEKPSETDKVPDSSSPAERKGRGLASPGGGGGAGGGTAGAPPGAPGQTEAPSEQPAARDTAITFSPGGSGASDSSAIDQQLLGLLADDAKKKSRLKKFTPKTEENGMPVDSEEIRGLPLLIQLVGDTTRESILQEWREK